MNFDKIYEDLIKLNIKNIKKDLSLKQFCSFRIGGNAKLIASINNEKELKKLIKYCLKNDVPYFIIGNGTNVLFSDHEYNGVIIKLKEDFKKLICKNKIVKVGASVSLFKLIEFCYENSLSRIEELYGIPGTVGGAVKINCGAYGKSFSDCIKKVKVFDGKRTSWIKKKNLEFGYRHSLFSNNKNTIILEAYLKFNKDSQENIKSKMISTFQNKKDNQPYNKFSAGSVFKKYEGNAVSKIIDELGLKGYKIGDAEISTKHAGFIVNNGNATCKDVISLIKYIKERILSEKGFEPELEIELVGDFNDIIR